MSSSNVPPDESGPDRFGPVFSVSDRGSGIVTEAVSSMDNPRPTSFTVAVGVLAAGVWGVGVTLGAPNIVHIGEGFPWLLGIVIPIWLALGVLATVAVSESAYGHYGRRRASNAIAAIPPLLGCGFGALVGAALTIRDSARAAGVATMAEVPDGAAFPSLLLAVAGGLAVLAAGVSTLLARRAVRYAVRQQHLMNRLRHSGSRTIGVLATVEFQEKWSDGHPLFEVTIALGDGPTMTTFSAHCVTRHDRVPLPGNRVQVWFDPQVPLDRAALVELDPAVTPRFDPKSRRYVQPDGT